ncbi:hypothetical protein SAMN05660964_02843 [Thiothrix caldifontis]|uniref:Uncharacterized protein n=1 Tax=Thiothrix caldifontis TaxID=525918 RepID=A0A1H4F753_9GAMM|nr:hypothetical protein [Thiothrix caldifontis]SEA92302.1 hypothetical protein SAMN05660964_02843 [Thiothrix caldifontis]
MFMINNQSAYSQSRANDILDKKQFKEINAKSGKSRSAAMQGDSANRSQLMRMISNIISQLMGQLGTENTHNAKPSGCHCKPDQPATNEPPTVNTINGSNALKSYLSSFYASAATIQDVNGDGKISAGDRLDYGAGEEALRYVTIDQPRADALNELNALTDPGAYVIPGVQGTITPNAAQRSYLDTHYSSNAELYERNGDGKISAGDSLGYQDAQGTRQTIIISQALAEKLNDPNLDPGGLSSPPGEVGHQALDLDTKVRAFLDANYFNANIIDNDDDGKISIGDSLTYKDISGNFQTQSIDQALAEKLNDLNTLS